jgi:hypothetical protein
MVTHIDDQRPDPGRIPLRAVIVLSARKNAVHLVGGPPITLAFSEEYLTWSDMYDPAGHEGAVAWSEVSAVFFRRGRNYWSAAEFVIQLNSGKEIIFDTVFPGSVWRGLRRGLQSIGSPHLLSFLLPPPTEIMAGRILLFYILILCFRLPCLPYPQ